MRPPFSLTRRLLLALAALAALTVAACVDDDGDDEEQESAEEATDAIDWVWCENPDQGFAVQAPAGWEVETSDAAPVEPCQYFDPDPGDITDGLRSPAEAEIELSWAVGPFDEAVTALAGETDESGDEETIDGRSAIRLPIDDPRWVVDLRAGRHLTIATETETGVVDRMARSMRWTEAAAAGEGLDPVGEATFDPITSDDFPRVGTDPLLITDLRAAGQDGFDRVVIELAGDEAPSFDVRSGDLPFTDADGVTVPVEGRALVVVTVTPATISDEGGNRVFRGQDRVPTPDAEVLEEVVRVSDDEEHLLLIGLSAEHGYAVTVFEDPTRLVVDIVHGD